MHDLRPLTPLGGTEPRIDAFDGLRIAERCDRAMASLAAHLGQEQATRRRAGQQGLSLPEVAGLTRSGGFSTFWTGPDQWMVTAPFDSHETLALTLAQDFAGIAAVTEQTDAWAQFDLAGPGCLAVLERLSPADPRAMQSASAIRTAIEHMGCFLICRTPGREYSMLGPRASAASLHHALTTAAKSAL